MSLAASQSFSFFRSILESSSSTNRDFKVPRIEFEPGIIGTILTSMVRVSYDIRVVGTI